MRVRRNRRLKRDSNHGNAEIIWAADDPTLLKFETVPRTRPGEEPPPPIIHTVASYFEAAHGIKLKYPKMPILFIGKKEWYPIVRMLCYGCFL